MKFAYHMHGEEMGELKLEAVSTDGTQRQQLFHNTEYEDMWKEYEVTVPTQTYDYRVSVLHDFFCKQLRILVSTQVAYLYSKNQ